MRMETEVLMDRYKDNLFAVAFNVCKNAADADDVVQDTFVQYHTQNRQFESEQHIKAWLIRVAINRSINVTRSLWRRSSLPLEDYMESLPFEAPEDSASFQALAGRRVLLLEGRTEQGRVVIHLFYYEDYPVKDIAGILKVSENNVKVRLSRGRALLKKALKEEWSDDEP